ncbi:uncharacterized protein OCT59_024401 [Rhizophagus irregularis]|uniref:Tpk3p n=2 Tax=Rhizophagus irregularis TaxID=588596 RepID=A0A015J217_RHIIW|nr:kinase-like domain-containing protein [Rhizophagus irregularis DAOM 181602=DAOM 197198]EXX60780.1 Tpk3p [Rhizophagus irregularis DAOM 197198w]POG65689.1 kinase-like domain-containing protein [Rhizophagus irregularis DAOM 181602=DAOM 197198]UZO04002.1 hypothetical protein OCT59_024401 [Rhizophagus irregularis]|eukprot:XP_025172555.1 kinase-like domain-containing protein [Rhizophagus irregularis DAOM 181602=DAOM 197198]
MSEMNEWINWIEEEVVSKKHIKHYEYKYFSNIQEIGISSFGKVYRSSWKNSDQYVALKSLLKFDNIIIKELVHELEFQREVAFHNNIISFYGITTSDQENQNDKKYLLVMEYADGGSLKNYLKENFNNLTWIDKYKLAYQLACAIAFLQDEGIVHHDLHSNNVLVHQGTIKLTDFGLSKKIDDEYKAQSDLSIVPYIDPKRLSTRSYPLNNKSNVYSIGVLLWEISKGQPPFYSESESYDNDLAKKILQGLREKIVPDTPVDYAKLYTECWDDEPDNRPSIHGVVERLKSMISQSSTTLYQNEDFNLTSTKSTEYNTESTSSTNNEQIINQNILHESELSLNMKELESTTSTITNDLSMEVDGITNFIFETTNKINDVNEKTARKQYILDYFNNNNIKSKEIYYWLLKNQNNNNNNMNSIFLLGYFYYYGIETDENYDKAFNFFVKASKQNHILAQYFVGKCYQNGYGIIKNENLAFQYFEKLANDNYAIGQLDVGYCYNLGIGIKVDLKKAIYWYEKSSNNGNIVAIYKLGQKYINGMGVKKDYEKAFELFKKSAEEGYLDGIVMLGACCSGGIGTNVDWKKAIESYQKAANLGSMIAQYNLANMYKNGEGIEKDISKAIYWFKISAEKGYSNSQKQLEKLMKNE